MQGQVSITSLDIVSRRRSRRRRRRQQQQESKLQQPHEPQDLGKSWTNKFI